MVWPKRQVRSKQGQNFLTADLVQVVAGVQAIAGRVSPGVYTWAGSGARLSSSAGEFVFDIAFQSSHHNQTVKNVSRGLHALVRSQALKRWRSG